MKLWRLAAALFLLASGPVLAQGSMSGNGGNGIGGNPVFCLLEGCGFTGAIRTNGIHDTGGIDTTYGGGYLITGLPALNLLANQTSPILSPETANAPDPNAVYLPQPLVVGYSATAGAFTYESMITSNLTVTGTVSNHYGQLESTINLLGTGIMSAELNQEKSLVSVPAGMSVLLGENKELALSNSGTISAQWAAMTVFPANQVGGTLVHGVGVEFSPYNYNTTGNTFQTWTAMQCDAMQGTGSAITFDQCFYNKDPNGIVTNAGHYGARPDTNVPTLSGCGTSPALNTRGNDDAGQITTGAGATACTLTFHKSYSNIATAIVIPSNGAANPVYTYATGTITMTTATAGAVYQYWVVDGF